MLLDRTRWKSKDDQDERVPCRITNRVDPLKTDLVNYLPDSELWEVDYDFPRPAEQWMQDFTYACDSSRGRMAGNRYFGIGLNFYFLGVSFEDDPDGVKALLVSVTRD